MRINLINNNIFHFIADTQYELTSSFIRMQEFYESPFDEIRGKYFPLDYYMDLYAEANDGVFSYFEDWSGFNIPGDSLIEFHRIFSICPSRQKEIAIFNAFENFIFDQNHGFYVIGTVGEVEALDHEYAHANYYLNADYRMTCNRIYNDLPSSAQLQMVSGLLRMGYEKSKIPDEIQAYMATSSVAYLMRTFDLTDTTFPINSVRDFQQNFESLPKMVSKPL